MVINNPVFSIPQNNRTEEKKPGGGDHPPYLGDINKFEQHKRNIVESLDSIISQTKRTKPKISNPDQLSFFELEFHQKAISKSAQPTKLLDRNHITVLSQIGTNSFVVATTQDNLSKFRDSTTTISIKNNKDDSAYLSAITSIENVNKDDKFSKEDFPEDKNYNAFIFFYDALSETDCKEIYKEIKKETDDDSEFFVTTSGSKVVFGSFSRSFLDEISEPHPTNPIQKIEKSLFFTVQESPTIDYDLSEITVEPPESDAKVGIIDSGITDHFLFNGLLIGVEDFINDPQKTDLFHGTFVGSRAIFGETIEDQLFQTKNLFSQVRVLDVRVMERINLPDGRKTCGVSDRKLIDAVTEVVKKYKSEIKVYNLSLNTGDYDCTHTKKRHYISRELDALAYKYKVTFVISAGNNDDCMGQGYPKCFELPESVITPPADLLNGIVVGSVTDNESSKSVALYNEPSPFTRVGLLGTKKPDLVHFGGNISKYGRVDGLGVKGLSTDQSGLTEGIGTSYSAPVVSQIVARIYDYLLQSRMWDVPSVDLARALTLHSGFYELPVNSLINPDTIKDIVGFGVPDYGRALDCVESQATFIYTDILGVEVENGEATIRASKHKIKFSVPQELVGQKKKVKVKATLVYTPLTNSMDSLDYSLVDIELNLHYKNSKGTFVGGKLTDKCDDFRNKWNPVKSFEKVYTAYQGGSWEVWLTLNARGKADNKAYEQPYALVVSIEDVTVDLNDRINLYEIIRSQHKNYIQVLPSVRVKT